MSESTTLDVREIPPRERHPKIFQTFDALKEGEFFTLVNDHDPKPLFYQFSHEREGLFGWEYLEEGPRSLARKDQPRRLRLNIGKTEAGTLIEANKKHPEGRRLWLGQPSECLVNDSDSYSDSRKE